MCLLSIYHLSSFIIAKDLGCHVAPKSLSWKFNNLSEDPPSRSAVDGSPGSPEVDLTDQFSALSGVRAWQLVLRAIRSKAKYFVCLSHESSQRLTKVSVWWHFVSSLLDPSLYFHLKLYTFREAAQFFRMYNLTVIFSIFRFGIVHKNALLGFGKQRDNVHSFFN